MSQTREQWGSRFGFVMAAVGSAIGLGNIWRFPYQAYENGGGAFLIPYFFALLTAGIPMLILEFGLGHTWRGGAPSVFARMTRKYDFLERWEWLGWWQILLSTVIAFYYVMVIAWAFSYIFVPFVGAGWGSDTKTFFFDTFLKLKPFEVEVDGVTTFSLGGIQRHMLGALIVMWAVNWLILYSGVKRGIELANKIFMPTLIVLMLVLLVRSLFLKGATTGLQYLFEPKFEMLKDVRVWAAAYGQIFFSLSVGFAVMITYASYLPKKSDIVNNAFLTGLLNCGFSMLAGITIFAILGSMAHEEGKEVTEVVSQSIGLAFVTIPKAISYLPASRVFGVLFFLSLTIAGLSSLISITETVVASFGDKYNISRRVMATVISLVGFAVSLVFATRSGLLVLDIVDHFIMSFGIVFAALMEILLLCWVFKSDLIRDHVNPISDFAVGYWWKACLKYVTPIVLGSMAFANVAKELSSRYEGYPAKALLLFGWIMISAIVVIAYFLQYHAGHDRHLRGHEMDAAASTGESS